MSNKLSRYEDALRRIMNADNSSAEDLRGIATNALFDEIKHDNPEQQEVALQPLQKVIITITETGEVDNSVNVSCDFQPDVDKNANIQDNPALACWATIMTALENHAAQP